MRWLIAPILALTAWIGSPAVLAQDACDVIANPAELDRWPLIPEHQALLAERVAEASWDEDLRLLLRLESMLRSEPDDPLGAFEKLAELAKGVAKAYRGTPETAQALPVSDLQPTVCGTNPLAPAACAWKIMGGEVKLPADIQAPCDAEKRIASYVRTLASILGQLQLPHVADAARRLTRYDQQWENLLLKGYSQYPWEVAINGLLQSSEGWGPNKNQLIIGHAFAGFGVGNVGGKDGADAYAAAVVGLEAVGYLRYVRDFRAHFGAGLAGTSPNLTWKHRGWGPALHLSGVSLGYAYGFRSDQQHTVYLIVDVTRGIDDGLLGRYAKKRFEQQLDEK